MIKQSLAIASLLFFSSCSTDKTAGGSVDTETGGMFGVALFANDSTPAASSTVNLIPVTQGLDTLTTVANSKGEFEFDVQNESQWNVEVSHSTTGKRTLLLARVVDPKAQVVALLHNSGVVVVKEIPEFVSGELFYNGTSKRYLIDESELTLDSIPAAVSLNLSWSNNMNTVLGLENLIVLPDDTLTVKWAELFPNN
jgi:hypothetical protein